MKIFISLMAMLLMIASAGQLLAQEDQGSNIKISGSILNLSKTDTGRRVYITYNSEDWFSKSGFKTLLATVDSTGSFMFKLPNLGKPYKINMVLRLMKGEDKYYGNKTYFTEPGDNVHIAVNLMPKGQTIWRVTGVGNEKYKLVNDVDDRYWSEYFYKLDQLKIDQVKDTTELNRKMEDLSILIKTFQMQKSNVIQNANVSPVAKKLIDHEFAKYYPDWTFRTELLLKDHPEWKNQIGKKYLKYEQEFYDVPDTLSVMCPVHILQINTRIKVSLMVSNKTDKVDFTAMYDTIKNNFSGYLRDRLIGAFIFSRTLDPDFKPHSTETRDSIYEDAMSIVHSPNIKRAISQYATELVRTTGNKTIIDGEFTDIKGKKISLKSLKGKVILIDAWFNGCSGCAQFHKLFEKEIYPLFKANKEFVVLSINVDSDKNRWLAALKTEVYSSNNSINVTTGDWFNGQFMKYYGVTTAPFLMLVDKNGIIRYKPREASGQDWIDQIDKALKD